MFSVASLFPSPPHVIANAHIKFRFDMALNDPEWKNPINFGENRKTKMTSILFNYTEKACARHNFIRNATINFIFDRTIHLPGRKGPTDFGDNWSMNMAAGGHFEKKKKKSVLI